MFQYGHLQKPFLEFLLVCDDDPHIALFRLTINGQKANLCRSTPLGHKRRNGRRMPLFLLAGCLLVTRGVSIKNVFVFIFIF